MSDVPGPVDPAAAERSDIAKIVVLSGWSLTIAACLFIIGAAVYLAIARGDAGPLKEWAGLCLGFLLGNFVTLVKDYIKVGA